MDGRKILSFWVQAFYVLDLEEDIPSSLFDNRKNVVPNKPPSSGFIVFISVSGLIVFSVSHRFNQNTAFTL